MSQQLCSFCTQEETDWWNQIPDLQSLLPFVPSVHHSFYKDIISTAIAQDVGLADNVSSDNNEDGYTF